jgi:hypothetical protein
MMNWRTPSPPAEKTTDSHEDRLQLSVALTAPRLRTLHRAEDIGSALKGGVNVCQRQLNEVRGFLVTEFVRNFRREDATPYQRSSNAILHCPDLPGSPYWRDAG